ncbi:MAG TPA: polysaccharide biosynthesis C-terminal domain-containing protein, partial [Phycisphaeraceae bacterium]
GVAIATAVSFGIIGPVSLYLAMRPIGRAWKQVAQVLVKPVLLSLAATFAAAVVAEHLPRMPFHHLVRAIVAMVVGGGLYVIAARQFMPQTWNELARRLGDAVQQRASRRSTFPVPPST